MRPHLAFAIALAATGFAAQAHAQSRYGPPSPIPSPAPSSQTWSGPSLSWPGKAPTSSPEGEAAASGRPEPLSPWARRQTQGTAAAPVAVASLPPSPSTPRPIASEAARPAPAAALPALRPAAAETPPAPAAAPVRVAPPAMTQAPAATAPAPSPVQAAAPAPQATGEARPYPGYKVPQLQHYPGYDTPVAAPVTPAPAPAQAAAATARPGARIYSVGREFGMQPDPIPPPTQPVAQGAGLTLAETPSTPSLAAQDDTDYQPRARPDSQSQPKN